MWPTIAPPSSATSDSPSMALGDDTIRSTIRASSGLPKAADSTAKTASRSAGSARRTIRTSLLLGDHDAVDGHRLDRSILRSDLRRSDGVEHVLAAGQPAED